MAKKDNDLVDMLRDSGMRKKVARAVAESADGTKHGNPPEAIAKTVERLRNAASELESRADDSRRTESAKKAARTRKRNATQRSTAAKKAARTRAK